MQTKLIAGAKHTAIANLTGCPSATANSAPCKQQLPTRLNARQQPPTKLSATIGSHCCWQQTYLLAPNRPPTSLSLISDNQLDPRQTKLITGANHTAAANLTRHPSLTANSAQCKQQLPTQLDAHQQPTQRNANKACPWCQPYGRTSPHLVVMTEVAQLIAF
jgi:hypothetical protein